MRIGAEQSVFSCVSKRCTHVRMTVNPIASNSVRLISPSVIAPMLASITMHDTTARMLSMRESERRNTRCVTSRQANEPSIVIEALSCAVLSTESGNTPIAARLIPRVVTKKGVT
nr:hypothetical protein [Microbacterium esteraromaticum]